MFRRPYQHAHQGRFPFRIKYIQSNSAKCLHFMTNSKVASEEKSPSRKAIAGSETPDHPKRTVVKSVMGKNRKSKIERLPKGERRHAASKIVVLDPDLGALSSSPALPVLPQVTTDLEQPQPSPRWIENQNSPNAASALPTRGSFAAVAAREREPAAEALKAVVAVPVPARSRPPRLDDEALAKLLLGAGPAAILAALRVCVQWRRVALELLSDVSHVDLGKIYATEGGRMTPPSYGQVLNVLQRFPNLSTLVLHKWLYDDVLQDVAGCICTNFESTTLRDVEFGGVFVQGRDLARLVRGCPNVRTVRLSDHESVDDDLLRDFAAFYKGHRRKGTDLRCVTLARTRTVSNMGVVLLLANIAPAVFAATRCHGLRDVYWESTRSEPMEKLSVTNCNNLFFFRMFIAQDRHDVFDLNLSQCTQLAKILLRIDGLGTTRAFIMRRLNLSGCRALRSISVPQADRPWQVFENLEELVLFGVHNLAPQYFSSVFGLDQTECALPNLRRLILTGCRLEALKLIGYKHLTSVDVSGCPQLHSLAIRDSWQMETLGLMGRRTPYQSVHLVLPVKCVVRGRRAQWNWESYQSNQTVTYP